MIREVEEIFNDKQHEEKIYRSRQMGSHQKIYSLVFFLSLLLFFVNYIIQGNLMFTYSDYYGLIFKMGVIYWIGYVLLLILISYHYINFHHIDERHVYLTFFLLVLYFIATPFLYESLPRFEDTWGHSFLAQEIFESEKVNVGFSIYEQYPGSILFYGLMFHFVPSYYLMKFFPPLFYFAGVLVIYSLFKYLFSFKTASSKNKSSLSEKIAFLIPVFYMFFNWTVEDNHISPQFLMLNLYFLFIFISVKFLHEEKNRKKYFIALGLLGIVIVFSHPFTPIFLLLIFTSVFISCKRFRIKVIPIGIMILALFTVYSLYYTTTFESIAKYTNVFIEILRSGMKVENITHRLESSLLSRRIFLTSRIGITLMSIVLGMTGFAIMRLNGKKTTANFLIGWAFALVPFMIFVGLVVQGEFYERFALISSLPLAALVTYLFNEYNISFNILLIFLLLLSPFYFVGKYGNEAFESISMEKLMANCFMNEFDVNCVKDFNIVDSPIDYDIETFDKSRFVVSRENMMAGIVLSDEDIGGMASSIETFVEENKLNKIYSTNEASVYVQ